MRTRIADKPNEPKYREKFVLTANGYHGDMDYDFLVEEAVDASQNPDGEEMLNWLADGYLEFKKLQDYQKANPYKSASWEDMDFDADVVPMDQSGRYYPTVNEFALTYYNADGWPFNVEVTG